MEELRQTFHGTAQDASTKTPDDTLEKRFRKPPPFVVKNYHTSFSIKRKKTKQEKKMTKK